MKTPHAVTIPGAIDAWCKLAADHGTMPMSELLAPAIKAAEEGFILTPRVAHDWAGSVDKLNSDPDTARSYLPGGKAPGVGDKHRSPELGATLRLIGEKGRAGFYEGRVAEDIVAKLKSLGRPARTVGLRRPGGGVRHPGADPLPRLRRVRDPAERAGAGRN